MSWCTRASCLAHRRRVFLQLWPPTMAGEWCHTDLSRCESLPVEALDAYVVPEGASGPGWALVSVP